MSELAGKPGRPGTVHVVITCTSRKTLAVPARLRLDSVPHGSLARRAREWIGRLGGAGSAAVVRAGDLYAGEHWMIARSLPAVARDAQVRLWVVSAGYGLIPVDALVRPYAATFSGPSDRVPGGAEGARQWWDALTGWEGPAAGQSRSIRSLLASDPSASFLLALSAAYLNACRDDITAGARQIPDPDRLMVISAGARQPEHTGEWMVPASARLQALLGGTRQALNARIAAHLLAAGITSHGEASRYLTKVLAEQPPVRRYERKKLDDEEACAMIASRLDELPGLSASKMLREFRDAGYACEQQRFGQLHRLVSGART
jgi:hypothetical protein